MEKKRTTTATKCYISQGKPPNDSDQVEVHCGAFAQDYKSEIVGDRSGCNKQGNNCYTESATEKESVCLGYVNHKYRLAGTLNQVKLKARMRLTII